MRILKFGSRGPAVQLLQLALNRSGFGPLELDGFFCPATQLSLRQFQYRSKLSPDGVFGLRSQRALAPWIYGFLSYHARSGDTLSTISERFSTSAASILSANPAFTTNSNLSGRRIVIPFPFSVVPVQISCCSTLLAACVRGLSARYPFLTVSSFGKSVMGRPLWLIRIGTGDNRVLYNASHHANEWICSLLLLRFAEDLAEAFVQDSVLFGQKAADILAYSSIFLAVAVNPDGIDLCTGEIQSGEYYERALKLASSYPNFPFPSGWKANILGTDLNLQYPAGWELAKKNKYAQGVRSPAPADFVGQSPLHAPESRALCLLTRLLEPSLILAYHTQGEVIYRGYQDYIIPGEKEILDVFSQVSGYPGENAPYNSSFAGYKDWFIQTYLRPGFTIEAGLGENPLPLSDFDQIYRDNLGILTLGALLT